MVDPNAPPASASLLGMILKGKWEVIRELPRENTTGGYFSHGYIVQSPSGEEAFLKALDFSRALKEPNFVEAMHHLTTAYLYERDLLWQCQDKKMSRIVRAIDEGEEQVPGAFPPQVRYLVFELAEGDVRQHMQLLEATDLAWLLRSLHHVATGLHQLHGVGIAHQDMKPSNVLLFDNGRSSKVADLGRASFRDYAALHDEFLIAGDAGYAPPELLYKQIATEWSERRFACDAYHLGSLCMFLFAQESMTPAILERLDREEHPRNWGGTYADILPRVQAAFEDVLSALEPELPESCREAIVVAVRQLCNPEPSRRGHPLTRRARGNPFSLERYVSLFNHLASRAEYGLLR